MTPSLLLATRPLTSGTDTLNGHYTKRNTGIFSGLSSTSTTPGTPGGESECHDAHDASAETTIRVPIVDRQWTGMPIRAIVPLPRRKLGWANGAQDTIRRSITINDGPNVHATPSTGMSTVSPPRSTLTVTHIYDGVDMDSGTEIVEEGKGGDEEDEGSDVECHATATPRLARCSYESITATEGLSAWSFEELRVECYAQSLVARGTKPPPVIQPFLAIPPAFVPRLVPRS